MTTIDYVARIQRPIGFYIIGIEEIEVELRIESNDMETAKVSIVSLTIYDTDGEYEHLTASTEGYTGKLQWDYWTHELRDRMNILIDDEWPTVLEMLHHQDACDAEDFADWKMRDARENPRGI